MPCQRQLNMLLTTIKFMLGFQNLAWKKFNLHCKRPLLRQKYIIRGDKRKESCIVASLLAKTLKISVKMKFVSWVIIFQETLEYRNVISICYGWQQIIHLSFKVLVLQTWAIVQAITNALLPIVKLCVLNQNVGYWLLLDALILPSPYALPWKLMWLGPKF